VTVPPIARSQAEFTTRDDELTRTNEELANTLTHGTGAVASVVALVVLVILAARGGDAWEIVSVALFGATLIALYVASTLFHAAIDPRAKARLEVFDHGAIYLLIAGTYTPFTIGVLRGGWGWSLFGVIWGLALAGIAFKVFFAGRFRLTSTLIYLAMGWLVIIAAGPMLRQLDPVTLGWLLAGGLAYTAGTPFYHTTRFRYAHAVWHVFVLAGSVCHVIAVGVQL
jgi:hemolysin III